MKRLTVRPIPLFGMINRYQKPKMTYLLNFGETLEVYTYVWLIEGLGKKVLVDTGGTIEMAMTFGGRKKEEVVHIQTLEDGLGKFGLKPIDIDMVILTHLHWDHLGLAYLFENAKFIIQKDELSHARNPHPLTAQYFDRDQFETLNFQIIEGDSQIAEGIRVLFTPGHTAGGQSVSIDTEKGIAVITGFCCIQENFEPREEIRRKMPFIVPGVHLDIVQAYNSLLKVKESADIIIPVHDAKFLNIDIIPYFERK